MHHWTLDVALVVMGWFAGRYMRAHALAMGRHDRWRGRISPRHTAELRAVESDDTR